MGALLAYRFPRRPVVAVDRTARPAFRAWAAALGGDASAAAAEEEEGGAAAAEEDGAAAAGEATAVAGLPNLQFVQADIALLAAGMAVAAGSGAAEGRDGAGGTGAGALPLDIDERAFVLCVHGCNEVNRDAIALARRGGAAWLVLPCCLQVAPYVDARVKLPDDVRFALLCGAMAHRHDAQRVDCIDRRISARAIILMGGLV